MQVVGVDFGTTNVRLSTWDSNQDLPPEPKRIGAQGATIMPAVVALKQQPNGEVSIVVGEEADTLTCEPDTTAVVRNIKRLALSGDAYVDWHLETREQAQTSVSDISWRKCRECAKNNRPSCWEWNEETGRIKAWGQEFPVWDLISHILAGAFDRAGISGEFEWRAGCPVHANFAYRNGLAQVLSQLTGKGNTRWIVEEPILFLTLARRLGDLTDGSYLVYDLGGGSFDSALVEVRGDEMLVYGSDGHPLLGGSDIDDMLIKKLDYKGQTNLLRGAKERLTPSNPSETLSDGTVDTEVTWADVEATLREGGFIKKSLSTMRDAYVGAKVLWKRGEGKDDPPIGEIITRNKETGAVRFIWQLMWEDMAKDVDGIFLFGGPTKSPYFYQHLAQRFGTDKIITAADLLPALTGTPDLELLGISMGACYSYEDSYSPLYLNRIPAHVTLQNLQTGEQVEYEPHQHFTDTFKPFAPFVSEPLPQQKQDPHEYELTVTYAGGVVLEQHTINGYVNPSQREREQVPDSRPRLPATSLRLVIDRFGRVGVEKHSSGPGLPWTEMFMVVHEPPWQIPEQREALRKALEQQARYETEEMQREVSNIMRLPWDYPTP